MKNLSLEKRFLGRVDVTYVLKYRCAHYLSYRVIINFISKRIRLYAEKNYVAFYVNDSNASAIKQ
jgi:hypothetical protein